MTVTVLCLNNVKKNNHVERGRGKKTDLNNFGKYDYDYMLPGWKQKELYTDMPFLLVNLVFTGT